MKQLRMIDRAVRVGEVRPTGGHPDLIRLACLAMLSFAVTTAQAAAQQKYTKPGKHDCSGAHKQGSAAEGCEGSCCGDKKAAAKSPEAKTAAKSTTTGGDENVPRWVCEKPSVELPPLWQGTPVECVFNIRNDGTRDLTIQAKGG